MYWNNNALIYSPADICRFMTSPFASWMERYAIDQPHVPYESDGTDPMTALLQKKGGAHEVAFLQQVKDEGKTIVEVKGATFEEKFEKTHAAIVGGVDVVYQACLAQVPFRGFADFLVKVPNSCRGKSRLGDFHYEIWDTKLSKHAKPYFVMQLCCYAEMLSEIQGCYANEVVVVLGNHVVERLRMDDYRYYYQHLKEQFLAYEVKFDAHQMPDPADSTDWGRWAGVAQGLFEAGDHLNQVATITRSQIKALQKGGVMTATQLAELDVDYVAKVSPIALQRLKAQSRMQVKTKVQQQGGEERPAFEILLPAEGEAKGLALLPPPSLMDVFFDIEGSPLVEGGLEYLWGNTYFDDNGDRQFKDFWAHNAEEEKQCFQAFVAWVYARWQKDPTMHIYHYANYEIAACRKLMGRYGVCEYEIDQLLRNEVFVDLYTIVKHGVLLGEPRYSIKNVEHLYRNKRQTDVGSGGDSVVVYEQWREMPDGDTWETSAVLKSIRDYNRDDCDSTQELVAWLCVQQAEYGISYVGKTDVVVEEMSEEITEKIRLRDRLLALAEQERGAEKANVIETLAWLLEFHRREEKPSWWRLFDRLGLTEMELTDDLDCIAACTRTDTPPFKPTERARTLAFEYAFDRNQDLKPPRDGTEMWVLGEDGMKFSLHEIDMQRGLLSLKGKAEPPAVVTLIPNTIVRAAPIPDAVESVVTAFGTALAGDEWPENAIVDFLLRRSPRIKGHRGGAIVVGGGAEERLQRIIDAVLNLDNSYLCIQGPPGAGKTYTGKQVIAELVQQGFKVGICSNSHKAINNLLVGVAETCLERNIAVTCCCARDTGPEIEKLGIAVLKNNEIQNHIQPACVIGTTAWGFARDDVAGAFDYLFVDEAGQVSLANLVGISRAASNLVLM
ncbi:MAG: putative RecB family nuclease, partial [Candidatus Latescibacterota bacterium]